MKARKEAELALSMVNGRMPLHAQLLGYGSAAEIHLARWAEARLDRPEDAARAPRRRDRPSAVTT